MSAQLLRANGLMLLTAAIWGFAFVAQIKGMEHVGPYTFNAIRFLMGAGVILPLYLFTKNRFKSRVTNSPLSSKIIWSVCAGIILFGGASLQQIGLLTTTAGNAGFITGFYIVLIPIFGLLLKQNPGTYGFAGAGMAFLGLYFLSVSADFTVKNGDWYEIGGAFFWTAHVLFIGHFVKNIPPLLLAGIQFLAAGILSTFAAFITNEFQFTAEHFAQIPPALISLLYAGILSTAVAYTLQVVAQQHAHPAHAAIILSLEAVFAALGGYLLLDEPITSRMLIGSGLMLSGMVVSQLHLFKIPTRIKVASSS